MNKNKLLLIECEMKGPKGHFLDNLIESTKSFEKKLVPFSKCNFLFF